jgi:hypothetical protein
MNSKNLKQYLQNGALVRITTSNCVFEGELSAILNDSIIIDSLLSTKIISLSSIISIDTFKIERSKQQKINIQNNAAELISRDIASQEISNPALELEINTEINEEEIFVDLNTTDVSENIGTVESLADEPALKLQVPIVDEKLIIQSKPRSTNFDYFDITDVPWKEDGYPDEELFKGRDELIKSLIKHYKSIERTKTYMLYGLTRTGKSSILKYFDACILNEPVKIGDRNYKFISFFWDLSRAAGQSNAKDMWNYLIGACTAEKIKKLLFEDKISLPHEKILSESEYRSKHLREIIMLLKKHDYFPIILIDEFTYYENLVESRKVDNSFIQTFRQLTFDRLACFVYAGAYNLKNLLKKKEYGLTGQLVNIKEVIINQIDLNSARELITVFGKIKFTEDAVTKVLTLTYRIPYFIQILCKNIGYYCAENEINSVDKEIVEDVTKILVGDVPPPKETMVERLSSGTFDNNQYDASNEASSAVLSSIAFLEAYNLEPSGVKYSSLAELWNKSGVNNAGALLKDAVDDLVDRGILERFSSGTIPTYRIGVDLFRRWLHNEKVDIELALGKLNNLTSYA